MVGTTRSHQTITGGVDTHADTHTAAALDPVGRLLGHHTFPASVTGYQRLLDWLGGFGEVGIGGVEGTGPYGAGLARHLTAQGIEIVEVDRPNRRTRRREGKSDPIDAIAAARAVLAGTATGTPKTRTGVVEAIRVLRVLRVARSGAIKAHTAAINALHQMTITAPDPLRDQLIGLSSVRLVTTCSRLRPGENLADPDQAVKLALRRLARRCQQLHDEIRQADHDLRSLISTTAPQLIARTGVGPEVAGPASTEQRRRPRRQQRPSHRRHRPNALPPAHPRLRRSTPPARPQQPRNQSLPQTLRRPRTPPPDPKSPHQLPLTIYRSLKGFPAPVS
ncbi:IS110 family transposase [Nocardioides islandensis]|uniref:IS110 family transposase n=1 Tax=Nocardioides islandensis TaxID=433663 RepID=UPI001E52F93C|nr:transposase [Nocardioides islandensis]